MAAASCYNVNTYTYIFCRREGGEAERMRYEPVGYILEYEISALVFYLVIMARFFAARRFPNQKNRLFSIIMWVVLVDIILDLVSSVIIDNVFMVPLTVTFVVNTTFYFLQILLPLLMTVYTLALAEYLTREKLKRLLPLFLPGLLLLAAMLCNPLNHWFFYVDPERGYVHGTLFICTYIICLFYMCVAFLAAHRNRAVLLRHERMTIYRFLFISLAAMAIQYICPPLLISGVAIALSVILMYFTLQNPDSMVDATTGAFTYEAMLSFLRDRMCERNQVQLIAVKIQNMSRINELLGLENGSLLLRQISDFLRSGAQDSWVFRMRGSCFVAITRRSEDYRSLKEKVEDRVGRTWAVGDIEILLQASVCYISTEELLSAPISPEDAVNYLETSFAQDDRSGSRINSITLGAELLDRIRRKQAVETALRKALATGEGFELFFQPIWSVKQRRYSSAEVLLRFRHPTLGYISPDEFVPVAESNGLITALDEMVVRRACAFLRDSGHCRQLGLERLEINLSALEFMHNRLPQLLSDTMSRFSVDPAFLCFEITETAATESFELLGDCMSEIRRLGSEFALDDFGTGYANISQVIQLPFSMVKLDKTLLYGPIEVLEDMVRMFARMGRRTVVEGAETAAQIEQLSSFQVDYIQGFYYARPMNQQDFVRFLGEHTG